MLVELKGIKACGHSSRNKRARRKLPVWVEPARDLKNELNEASEFRPEMVIPAPCSVMTESAVLSANARHMLRQFARYTAF